MSEWTCQRCGRCCTEFAMFVATDDVDAELFWRLRGFPARTFENGQVEVKFKTGCAWLVWDGTKPRCANYDHRPKLCREYTCEGRQP